MAWSGTLKNWSRACGGGLPVTSSRTHAASSTEPTNLVRSCREALAAARAMTGGAVGVPGWKRAHRIAERSPAPMVPALRSLAHRAVGWWRWQIESRDLGQRGVRIAFRGTLTPEQKPERAA